MLELGLRSGQDRVMDLGIWDGIVHWNLTPEQLVAITLKKWSGETDISGSVSH